MTKIDSIGWQQTVVLPVGGVDETGAELRELTLRKMTGNEEALLAEPRVRHNGGKLITALLASCVRNADAERLSPAVIRRLSSADRNYLLLELRRLTFGDEMEARYRCPRCQSTTAITEDLAEIDVRRLDGDRDGDAVEIPVELVDGYRDPDHGCQQELVFGLPTGADEEAAASGRDANAARQRDALLARCLRRVGDLDPRRVSALGVRVLADLSMSDRRLVQRTLDATAPGPDLTRSIVCDHCGEEFRTTLDMSQFFPLA
jgi:hypothetical protein